MPKPINLVLAASGTGLFTSTTLFAVGFYLNNLICMRVGRIVFLVTFGVAVTQLVATLMWIAWQFLCKYIQNSPDD